MKSERDRGSKHTSHCSSVLSLKESSIPSGIISCCHPSTWSGDAVLRTQDPYRKTAVGIQLSIRLKRDRFATFPTTWWHIASTVYTAAKTSWLKNKQRAHAFKCTPLVLLSKDTIGFRLQIVIASTTSPFVILQKTFRITLAHGTQRSIDVLTFLIQCR